MKAKDLLVRGLLVGAISLSLGTAIQAQSTYYCNPRGGSLGNDGRSPANAWSSLEAVTTAGYFTSVIQGGDTIVLMSGLHGDVRLGDLSYGNPVTIQNAPGALAVLDRLKGNSVNGMIVDGIWVTHSAYNIWGDQSRGLINFWYGSNNITIRNCKVFSVLNSANWGYNEWDTLSSNGIAVLGSDNVVIEDNFVWNVYNGILFGSGNCTVRNNWVDNFVADGLRAAGNDLVIENNLITDNYSVGGVHSDALQFYAPGEVTFSNVAIRNNITINVFDQGRPFVGHLQGYTAFDNPINNWVIENNYMISDTVHGISVSLPASGCRVMNNTIYGIYNNDQHRATIRLSGSGNTVRNNIVPELSVGGGNTVDHNLIVTLSNVNQIFVAPSQVGFRLRSDSLAIDTGSSDQAPAEDFEGDSRPNGNGIDIGAEER